MDGLGPIRMKCRAVRRRATSSSRNRPTMAHSILYLVPALPTTRQAALPVFDCATRSRPFYDTLPPARREAYDRTGRLLLVFALLAQQRHAAHALWMGGVPVPSSAVTPCDLRTSESMSKWLGNPEQAWYDAVEAHLCLAVLDLIIIAAAES
ncbi:hypothetical protein C8R44DRAFT_883855 [Mycena epipterygia]|nr:hypothetical protein C8R44DRAFT_883855 [Mycena epipterygia]